MPIFLKYLLIGTIITAFGAVLSSLVFGYPLSDWTLWLASTLPAILLTPVCENLLQALAVTADEKD